MKCIGGCVVCLQKVKSHSLWVFGSNESSSILHGGVFERKLTLAFKRTLSTVCSFSPCSDHTSAQARGTEGQDGAWVTEHNAFFLQLPMPNASPNTPTHKEGSKKCQELAASRFFQRRSHIHRPSKHHVKQ